MRPQLPRLHRTLLRLKRSREGYSRIANRSLRAAVFLCVMVGDKERTRSAYVSRPYWATETLSRVVFLTVYIISSAWRMISWAFLASSG